MGFPYSYDQVIEAIASTRGDAAHFVLTTYLHSHREEVGTARFRNLLQTARLRGQDEVLVHVAIARLDPGYLASLPGVLRSARSTGAQQVLLANLPDVLVRGRDDASADAYEAWLLRRVKLISYAENGASWEIPSIALAVLYCSDASRARRLLAGLDPHLDQHDRELVGQAVEASSDERLEQRLRSWTIKDGSHRELTPSDVARYVAETERDALHHMRRLGFEPAT